MGDKCGRQVADKCKLPFVFHTCLPLWVPGAASFYTCLPLVPHTLGSWGHMSLHLSCHLSPTLVSHSRRLGQHEFTLVLCGPRHLEWETSVGDKWKTSVNSCSPRHLECETSVGDKWETSVNSCGPRHPEWETCVGHKRGTSANSCGPRHPEWETSVGDKCGRQVWETSGRQV